MLIIDLPIVESCVERCHNVSYCTFSATYSPPVAMTLSYSKTTFIYSFRLTGLVSFMLSDEMTTGSVTTSDADKRVYASRSHAWNLQQRRFREAFPEVSMHVPHVKAMPPKHRLKSLSSLMAFD